MLDFLFDTELTRVGRALLLKSYSETVLKKYIGENPVIEFNRLQIQ